MNYKALGSSILFVGVLVIVQGAAAEDQASHLNAQYKQAKAKKDIEQAADYICQAAALDQKKYEKKCENARAAVSESLKEYEGYWGSGTSELQQKDYPGAIRDLSQIAFGPLHDKAQTLIAQARAQQNGAPSDEDQSRQALLAAQEAYVRGNFTQAAAFANSVTTANLHPPAAQILNNIRIYNATLAQAEALEQSGDYKAAQQKYSFVAAINLNGPGNIPQKQHQLEILLNAPPVSAAQPAIPARPMNSETKDSALQNHTTAKERKALADARAAEASGDDQAALAGFSGLLAIDGRQPEALAGKERILNKLRGDPTALQDTLIGGIENFYASHYIEANDAISLYLHAGGVQSKGAAHFYLGATLFSQAILAGPGDKAKLESLHQSANQEFVLAKQENYRPIENEISPNILAEWKKSSGQH
jgi:hypothetical protein